MSVDRAELQNLERKNGSQLTLDSSVLSKAG